MPQTDSRSKYGLVIDPLGVYVHEFGHWLGLPDLYCTSYDCVGAGMWSLMADGSYNSNSSSGNYGSSPAHLDAWSLYDLGWVAPQIVSTATTSLSVALGPVESVPAPASPAAGTNVYKAQASTSTQSQYFLLENRQKIGFDAGLPGQGLLVWLIDDDIVSANRYSNTVNYYPSRLGVKLVEADGDWALLQSGSLTDTGSSGDPFPGSSNNTKLTPMTSPSSVPYTDYGWVNVRNISTSGTNTVNFTIGFGPLPPTGLAIDRSTCALSWNASNGALLYRIYKNGSRTSYVTSDFTSYTDGGCRSTDTYAVTAADASGNESQAALITPVITVTPLSLSLSDSVVSGTLTLSNSGNADLAIQSISLSGAGQSYFSYGSACGSTVAKGTSCSITVTFYPSSTGTKSAALSIATNDIQTPTTTVALSGSVSASSSSSSPKRSHGCFIATAAYGSYLDPHVLVLREFRDRYLLTNFFGRQAVSFYYRHSPALAAFIGEHEALRAMTRFALTPVVYAAAYPALAAAAVILGSGSVVLMRRRNRRKGN